MLAHAFPRLSKERTTDVLTAGSDMPLQPHPKLDAKRGVLSGQDIVCFAHEPWHGPWKAYQQILSLVAASNRVLYVGPPVSVREVVNGLRTRTMHQPVLERVNASLLVYHEPRVLVRANGSRPLGRAFNRVVSPLRLAHVRWLARRLGFHAPILWIFDPMFAHAVGTFRERLVIYHVLDDYVEFVDPAAAALRSAVARNDGRLLRQADLVVAVSDRLLEHCLQRNPHSYLVPNGVNYEVFQNVMARGEIPPDVRPIPHPIIGFVGAIQSHIDWSLLWRLSARHPEWSLVFVGSEELGADRPKLEALLAQPNVHYLGRKPVEEVPAYIGCCDVCVMPYHVTKLTAAGDRTKLYEYLACGRPVVSTDVPSVRRFLPLVRIAGDADEFVQCVEQSLAEEPHLREARMAVAREHTWQRRVETLREIIRPRLRADAAANWEVVHTSRGPSR